jgi:MoaA/NifB/PqqE/SkfB family radical SAM enzyme
MSPNQTLPLIAKNAAKWWLRRTLYRRAVYLPRPEQKPFMLRLDITNMCNLACKKCFYPAFAAEGHPSHAIPLDDFRLLASRLFDYAYCLQLACSFEPLMHPGFAEIIEEIDRHPIPNVGMVTNGTLLRGEKAEVVLKSKRISDLSISINSLDPATYEKLHGRAMGPRVVENAELFLALRRERGGDGPHVKINTVIMRSNLDELPGIVAWAADHGVDEVQFIHVEPFSEQNDESLAATPEAYNRVRDEARGVAKQRGIGLFLPPPMLPQFHDAATGGYAWRHCETQPLPSTDDMPFDPHPYPTGLHCICPWMTMVIDCWGNLFPCAHRNTEPFANILRDDLPQALNSIRILRLRRAMLRGRHREACPSCRPASPYSDPLTRRMVHIECVEDEQRKPAGEGS